MSTPSGQTCSLIKASPVARHGGRFPQWRWRCPQSIDAPRTAPAQSGCRCAPPVATTNPHRDDHGVHRTVETRPADRYRSTGSPGRWLASQTPHQFAGLTPRSPSPKIEKMISGEGERYASPRPAGLQFIGGDRPLADAARNEPGLV